MCCPLLVGGCCSAQTRSSGPAEDIYSCGPFHAKIGLFHYRRKYMYIRDKARSVDREVITPTMMLTTATHFNTLLPSHHSLYPSSFCIYHFSSLLSSQHSCLTVSPSILFLLPLHKHFTERVIKVVVNGINFKSRVTVQHMNMWDQVLIPYWLM